MFTTQERETLRDQLIADARADGRVVGAAITGSFAIGASDEWSDIDLAVSVDAHADQAALIADWTTRMYGAHGAVHHTDIVRGRTVFRVFLLQNTLQVDIAFWPAQEFGAIGPTFKLLFGNARQYPAAVASPREPLIGMGWLYALHARSSIARGRLWQAEHMISGMRDQAFTLACLRHGVPAAQGRGLDALPLSISAAFAQTLVRSLDAVELARAFAAACDVLLTEVEAFDSQLAQRLSAPLRELSSSARSA